MKTLSVGHRLISLRERSGMSLEAIAKAAGYRGPSSVQRYFAEDYDQDVLSSQVATRLSSALVGKGEPEITEQDIFELTHTGWERLYDARESVSTPAEHKFIRTSVCFHAAQDPRVTGVEPVTLDPLDELEFFVPVYARTFSLEAIIVSSTSMIPRYEPGEIILVTGSRSAQDGDHVMVRLVSDKPDSPDIYYFGKVISLTSHNCTLLQYHPQKAFMIPMKAVAEIRVIAAPTELLRANYA